MDLKRKETPQRLPKSGDGGQAAEITTWMGAIFLEDGEMSGAPSDWKSSKGIAKVILRDRSMRRKWMARWLLFTLAWMAVGLWILDGWLGENVLRFAGWWLFCGFLTVVLILFALYDSAAVVREERAEILKKQEPFE